MSLTAELRSPTSPLRAWFDAQLPGTEAVAAAYGERLSGLAPLRRLPRAARYPSAHVGQAVDYRIRLALCGEGFGASAALRGANLLTGRAQAGGRVASLVPMNEWPAWSRLLEAFFTDLAVLAASGAGEPDDEKLSSSCFVLALLESLWRAGQAAWRDSPLQALAVGHRSAIEELAMLRALAGPVVTGDVTALSALFLARCLPLLDEPYHCNPEFAGSDDVYGADADLIAGPLLIDFKTVSRPVPLQAEWIYQLVGYCLLDYEDRYAISSVGLYLARHGELVSWPLDELLESLGGPETGVGDLRAGMRRVIAAARRDAGT